MTKGICTNCKKEKEITLDGKSQGLCKVCYKKLLWKPKLLICKRCKRELPIHAKGLCSGCYSSIFHVEQIKEHNRRKYHNINPAIYKKITEQCIICGFDKLIELHHLDLNHQNSSETNMVGLCPNHHRLVHHRAYRKEVFQILESKGFKIPEIYQDDSVFKSEQQTPV